jgi:hypothetical protein
MSKLSEEALGHLKVMRDKSLSDIAEVKKELATAPYELKYVYVNIIDIFQELADVYDETLTRQMSSTKLVNRVRDALNELAQFKEFLKDAQPD